MGREFVGREFLPISRKPRDMGHPFSQDGRSACAPGHCSKPSILSLATKVSASTMAYQMSTPAVACTKCGAYADTGHLFCNKCGAALLNASLLPSPSDVQQPTSALVLEADTVKTLGAGTTYFAVSPLKLVIMATCTFGLYEIYWSYKHWCCVRERETGIMPAARAFFTLLFCYALFDRIGSSGKAYNIARSISPGLLAFGYIVVTILIRLPDPLWLLSYFSVLFLVPVQMAANEINQRTNPNHEPNKRFSAGNIMAAFVGGVLTLLVAVGSFVPAT